MPLSPNTYSGNAAFVLWIVGGVAWAFPCGYFSDYWFANYMWVDTFQIVGSNPELEAQQNASARLRLLINLLLLGSITYGVLGAVVFRRWGNLVIGIAIAIGLLAFLAQAAPGLGRL